MNNLTAIFLTLNSDSEIFGIPPDTSRPPDSSSGGGGSLLLIDDPDALTLCSPSPENFDLDHPSTPVALTQMWKGF
ncbi:hypothetical protein PM082_020096 [Marasmius tenuissimus]|nr:hypothetical protein PM082_020096 [Marasmius tenuissimus]